MHPMFSPNWVNWQFADIIGWHWFGQVWIPLEHKSAYLVPTKHVASFTRNSLYQLKAFEANLKARSSLSKSLSKPMFCDTHKKRMLLLSVSTWPNQTNCNNRRWRVASATVCSWQTHWHGNANPQLQDAYVYWQAVRLKRHTNQPFSSAYTSAQKDRTDFQSHSAIHSIRNIQI